MVKIELPQDGLVEDAKKGNPRIVARKDKAQIAKKGGIDLDRAKMQMNINKQGEGVQMHFNAAMIQKIKRDGFDGAEFKIESILPANLPLLLDLRREEEGLVGV